MLESNSTVNHSELQEVAKKYTTLLYPHTLSVLLKKLYPEKDFSKYKKYTLHKLINEALINHYKGEEILKYALFKEFLSKKVTAGFELKVNNSRADFLTINGNTTSFEIKSSRDNLDRLKKQSTDYLNVFEYNYVVTDYKHLSGVETKIPDSFGIWTFDDGKKKQHRQAALNGRIKPEQQLKLLTKKELAFGFEDCSGVSKKIIKTLSNEEINRRFKVILKSRFKQRWSFLVDHSNSILPLDVQFFFNTNVNPRHIYYH